MRVLLDTHILLWWLIDSPNLSKRGRAVIVQDENTICISAASIWEMRIKESIGKLVLPKNFETALSQEGFEEFSISVSHAHVLAQLPMIHKDPFDRLLAAQAKSDSLVLLSHDSVFSEYPIESIIV